jgi:hypothetical protein
MPHYNDPRRNAVKKSLALLAFLLVLTLPALAQEADREAEVRALLDEVLDLYGVKAEVSVLPALLQAQLENQESGYPPEVYTVLREAFGEAYRADGLYKTLLEHMAANAEPGHLEAAREWLRSPLAQKLVQMEIEASSPDAQEELQSFMDEFDADAPESRQRLQVIQALDEAGGATEVALAVSVETVRAVVSGVQPLLPEDKRMPGPEIEREVGRLEIQLQMTMRYGTWLSLLYTYREASDDELMEYLAFLESAEGNWLNHAAGDALIEAIRVAGQDAGRRIAKAALDRRAMLTWR